jgi:hypothetical protein
MKVEETAANLKNLEAVRADRSPIVRSVSRNRKRIFEFNIHTSITVGLACVVQNSCFSSFLIMCVVVVFMLHVAVPYVQEVKNLN